MNRIKNLAFLFTLLMLTCCSDDNPEIKYSITSVNPTRAKIGDTITIKGNNLKELNSVSFAYADQRFANKTSRVTYFISKSDNEIKLIVPEVYHDKILLAFPAPNTNKIELNIFGLIPILNDFEQKIYEIQVVDENTAYLRFNNNTIYKSSDGYYSWTKAIEPPNNQRFSSFFFLDENIGWFGVAGSLGVSIYYTEDGGKNLSLKHQVNNTFDGSNDIRKVFFTSQSKGMFSDGDNTVYLSTGNSWTNIYDYYPDLALLPFGTIGFFDFKMINENLFYLSPANGFLPYIVKIENDKITNFEFEGENLTSYLYGNQAYAYTSNSIYKSSGAVSSWTKIQTINDTQVYPLGFINNHELIKFIKPYSEAPTFYLSEDGITWNEFMTLIPKYSNQYLYLFLYSFKNNNGIIGSQDGTLFKFIR